jgi:hypothetical protein
MSSRIRAFLLSLTIVAVLAFSVVGTTVAYADGEKPPEPAPTEPAVEPETVTVDTVVSDATKTAPTEDTGVPVEEAATPAPVEEAAPPAEETAEKAPPPVEEPILDAVPENTTVTVVNAEGESQPLATQESADAIATTTDPIWCPAGQAPTPGANGCTPTQPSFTALLDYLNGNASYSGAGTIYVEAGAVQGGAAVVDFNNYNLSNISNADLTITGGWNVPSGTIDPNTPSTLTSALVIGSSANPWGGSLFINNISINGTSGTGLTLYAQNNIELDNVTVTNSQNGAGALLDAGVDVSIDNSNFNQNKTAGAIINAGRDVAIQNSNFNNPINARRQQRGVEITSGGAVSLFNVMANSNRVFGANITAGGPVAIAQSVFSGTMEISGSNFLGYGLTVVTPSVIALDGVTANDNFLWGASLDAGGDVDIANSIFNANTTEDPGFIDDTGLLVTSGGNVSIQNSQANDNRLIGATINATGDVSISNSQFNSNNGITFDAAGNQVFHGLGLQVVTLGSIFLDGVTASGNTLFGAHLDAGLDVQITNSTFSSNSTLDSTAVLGRGLEVISDGNVSMTNVVLDGNQTFGANIQTTTGFVFLDTVTATNNGTNGVEVQTNCATVFLLDGTYTGNGQYGLSILNSYFDQTGGVFGGNGVGDIFQSSTCPPLAVPTAPTTPPVTPPTTNPGTTPPTTSGNPVAGGSSQGGNSLASAVNLSTGSSLFKSSTGTLAAKNLVTLHSLLSANGTIYSGIFAGKYTYVHSTEGLQIFVLSPNSLDGLALGGA